MKNGKQLDAIVHENDVSLQRRANLAGKQLTDAGFTGVKITLAWQIEAADDGGKTIKKLSGVYSGYPSSATTSLTGTKTPKSKSISQGVKQIPLGSQP